jgi:secreted PhoX family phosphatase
LLACLCHVALEYCVFSRTRSEQAMASTIRDDDGVVNPSHNPHLNDLVDAATTQSPARRDLLKSGFGLASLSFLGLGAAACGSDGGDSAPVVAPPVVTPPKGVISFKSVAASSADTFVVPEGYTAQVLYRWGDPIYTSSPAFKGDASESSLDQEGQSGDNHDGMQFFPLKNADGTQRSDAGVLAINHEYINPEYFYAPGSDPANWMNPFTFEKAKKAQAGHGVSIVEVRRKADASWEYLRSSPYNRRITAYTAMQMTGPAAGNALLKTAADPTGTEVLGTLNNCANGRTPWGTYLTCEENFNGYFGWNGARTADVRREVPVWHQLHRLRLSLAQVDPRFDADATPTSRNRFGWVVEIDPFAPASKPVKRTALGRFKHENAALVVAANGKVVVYMGDDERNEYIYKFVSSGRLRREANPTSAATADLLDERHAVRGPLRCRRHHRRRMGTGTWIPAGAWPERPDRRQRLRQPGRGADQGAPGRRPRGRHDDGPPGVDLVPIRRSRRGLPHADQQQPARRHPGVFQRGGGSDGGRLGPPAGRRANPRANNVWGHIVRWNETGGDATALTFAWDIFVLAGQPKKSPTADRAPSANITVDNLFNSPDGLAFDQLRPPVDPDRRQLQQRRRLRQHGQQPDAGGRCQDRARRSAASWSAPSGCEITGVTWTPDRKTMFVNVQHPGEIDGGHPNAAEEGRWQRVHRQRHRPFM